MGQRGWNGQPLGGWTGEGTSPGKMMRWRFVPGSISGMAEISACAGMLRVADERLRLGGFHDLPGEEDHYQHAVADVLHYRQIKREEHEHDGLRRVFRCCCKSRSRFMICACTDTSSALTGSSADA